MIKEKISEERVFYLETYQKNRIVNKLTRILNQKEKIKVLDVESFGDSRIFEVRVISEEDEDKTIRFLKETICDIIKDVFPNNYLFDFGARRLGFTNSFNVFTKANRFCFECYHRIKEIRKDGSSIIPEAINQIKGA